MFCKEHPDYQAKRRPRVNCFSCWRLFTESRGATVEDFIAEARRANNSELVYWLRESIDDIIYAPLEEQIPVAKEETKAAKFSSAFEFLGEENPDEPKGKNEQESAKGVII